MQSYLSYLNFCEKRINSFLQQILESLLGVSDSLFAATKYSLLSGGKRLRPALVYAIGDYLEINELTNLDAAAASVELIHCYSLVHDDLPAMDNDDLRRGVPSCHKAFNEATAMLVGDGLQALAFQVLTDPIFNQLNGIIKSNMVLSLSKAVGFLGMVNGQAQDMTCNKDNITLNNLEKIHKYKTGALIVCCIELAILATGAENNNLKDLKIIQQQLLAYGSHLGLIFQIKDDILDFEQSTEILGKPNKSDQRQDKTTFVTLLGLTAAKQQLDKHYNKAMLILKNLALKNNKNIILLQQFVDYFKNRKF